MKYNNIYRILFTDLYFYFNSINKGAKHVSMYSKGWKS